MEEVGQWHGQGHNQHLPGWRLAKEGEVGVVMSMFGPKAGETGDVDTLRGGCGTRGWGALDAWVVGGQRCWTLEQKGPCRGASG